MNAHPQPEVLPAPRISIEAVAEPLPPMVYRSEGFAEDLEPELADEGLAQRLRRHFGALMYALPLVLALVGTGETLWVGSPF